MNRFAVNGYFARTYELWRATETVNEVGAIETTWNKQADVPGRAYPTQKAETYVAHALQGEITWAFTTPSDTDIQKGDEVRFDGRRLKVQVVGVTSTGRRIEALCKELP